METGKACMALKLSVKKQLKEELGRYQENVMGALRQELASAKLQEEAPQPYSDVRRNGGQSYLHITKDNAQYRIPTTRSRECNRFRSCHTLTKQR